MSERNDGGPAFPLNPGAGEPGHPAWTLMQGMALRDWFAGQADIGDLRFESPESAAAFVGCLVPDTSDVEGLIALSAIAVAKIRYIMADAMLAERAKGGGA